MMQKKARILIIEYVDYRYFLSDYVSHQKQVTRGFTFRSFAQKAELSASLLKDILSHRQNLTLPAMHKYAAAMKLSVKETTYFEALVGFTNATTNSDKNRFFGEMAQLRGRSSVRFLDTQQYAYFSEWHHAVVRELVTHAGFGCNAEAIAKQITPALSTAKVRTSINLLKKLNLIYADSFGTWHAADRIVSSEYEITSVALKNYHIGMLEQAAASLETCPSEEREFQGITISASRETFLRMKERIRCFTDELLAMAAADDKKTEEVYQINLQMFPFTRRSTHD